MPFKTLVSTRHFRVAMFASRQVHAPPGIRTQRVRRSISPTALAALGVEMVGSKKYNLATSYFSNQMRNTGMARRQIVSWRTLPLLKPAKMVKLSLGVNV